MLAKVKIQKSQERTMKENIRKLHTQKTIWKSHGKNSICLVFFCVNDNKYVDLKCFQTIKTYSLL